MRIDDYTPLVTKMNKLIQSGDANKAKRHLPPEKIYTVSREIGRRIVIVSRRWRNRRRHTSDGGSQSRSLAENFRASTCTKT